MHFKMLYFSTSPLFNILHKKRNLQKIVVFRKSLLILFLFDYKAFFRLAMANINFMRCKMDAVPVGRLDLINEPFRLADNNIENVIVRLNIQAQVARAEEDYYGIAINKVMEDFKHAGILLKMAWDASKIGTVIDINVEFSSLTTKSFNCIRDFQTNIRRALVCHSKCAIYVNGDRVENAQREFNECTQIAQKLVSWSRELINETERICNIAKDALCKVAKRHDVGKEQKEAIKEKIDEYSARQSNLETQRQGLEQAIARARVNEERILQMEEKRARAQERASLVRSFAALIHPFVSMASSFVGGGAPQGHSSSEHVHSESRGGREMMCHSSVEEAKYIELGKIQARIENIENQLEEKRKKEAVDQNEINGLQQELESLKKEHAQKQKEANDSRGANAEAGASHQTVLERYARDSMKYTMQHISVSGELAGVVRRLQDLNVQEHGLKKTIESLEVAIELMGRVLVVFNDIYLYWGGIKAQCEDLETLQISEALNREERLRELTDSAMLWVTLYVINQQAFRGIQRVYDSASHGMRHLISENTAKRIEDVDVEAPVRQHPAIANQ